MRNIFITLKRLQRLSRPRRIAHLQALVQAEPARSIRRADLETALKAEMTAQLRKEVRAA